MKCTLTLIISLFFPFFLSAQSSDDTITARIILIGDAGALVGQRSPVIDAAKKLVPLDKKTSVIFLGDNLYRHGLPDDQSIYYTELRSVLDSQVSLVRGTPAKAYFIPGNHDWANGAPDGYAAVLRQQRYIDRISPDNVSFYPKNGCPGPVEIKVNDDVVIVIIDSQWWIHKNEKPGLESDCPQKTKEEVLVELEDILAKNDKKFVIFADHHPFRSNGVHSGYFTLKQHLFPFTDIIKNLWLPLPGLGSVYPISRSVFGSPQDLKHPGYQNLINEMTNVIKGHPHVVLVAGHEHNLQYFADSSLHYIVSGAGCKTQRVNQSRNAEFVAQEYGFALLEVSTNKNVKVSFYTVKDDTAGLAFQDHMLNFKELPAIEDTIPQTEIVYEYRDSVFAPASISYKKSSKLKRVIQGDNYREVWSTPVLFPEFSLKNDYGGFTIESRGGGKQTKSLTLKDKKGQEWKLRTIDKDISLAIPENFRANVAKDLVQDVVSSAFPYAPVVVPVLADAAGVKQSRPKFYFIPNDPAFGYYQKLFANKIATIEKKDPLGPTVDTKNTFSVLNNMIEDNDHLVNQDAVLRARLLDILIGDWDRHFDQWKWAVTDTGKGKLYVPIAKDRDQAFFYSDGLLLKAISLRVLPLLQGFQYEIKAINGMGFSSRDFDRIFLNGLSARQWDTTITSFQKDITDSVIDASVKQLPREIYPLSGETIAAKLKSRRNLLHEAAMTYHRFISKNVNILGSNKEEYFDVSGNDSGLLVQVYAREKYGDTGLLVYNRQFDPKVTKELRLYGFNGNDRYNLKGHSGIRVRMIGGRGNDTFSSDARIKNFVYDLKNEDNTILHNRRTKNRMAINPDVNEYKFNEFVYDVKPFPNLNIGFNSEDILLVGLSFLWRTHGFRKDPYESENKLATLYSPFNQAFNFRYRGEFNHVFRTYDFVLGAEYYNPSLNNFFGLGNETKNDLSLPRFYYRTRYKYGTADFQLRKRLFSNVLSVSAGPSFYYYFNDEEESKNRILEYPSRLGLDSASIFNRKTYLGGKINLYVNNLNNTIYPTRGVEWNNEFVYYGGIDKNSNPLTKFTSDMTIYASLARPNRLLAVLRLGGGRVFSENYEYFQALNIGANNYLRGFRKNRFSGSSLLYLSTELRFRLFNIKSYLLPGQFGILGFDDVGRVWKRNEDSRKWHNAYGAGIYYLPYNLITLSATAGFSEEGTIFNFTVGTKLNLYF